MVDQAMSKVKVIKTVWIDG